MFPLLRDRGKRLDCARVGRGHLTYAVPQWRHATVEALLEAVFFRVSDREKETEIRLQLVLGWEWETSVLIREVYVVTVLIQVSSRWETAAGDRSWRRPEQFSVEIQMSEVKWVAELIKSE
jgi:hypothetical protein